MLPVGLIMNNTNIHIYMDTHSKSQGWKDSSWVKTIHCISREPEISSESITACRGSAALFWPP